MTLYLHPSYMECFNLLKKENIVIKKCEGADCVHAYQDKKYRGKRVCNPTNNGHRCTVCNTEKRTK